MIRRTVSISLLVLLAGAMALSGMAQNPRQVRGGGPGPGVGAATIVTLEGVVDSVNAAYGQGTPSFTITLQDGKKATIVASPFRTVQDANFKIAIGDNISVLAFPSLQHEGAYVAQEIKNLSTGSVITLRDDAGIPIGGRAGRCAGCAGLCPGLGR